MPYDAPLPRSVSFIEGTPDTVKAHYISERGMDLHSGSRFFIVERAPASMVRYGSGPTMATFMGNEKEPEPEPKKRWTGEVLGIKIRDEDYEEVNEYMDNTFGSEFLNHFYKYEV